MGKRNREEVEERGATPIVGMGTRFQWADKLATVVGFRGVKGPAGDLIGADVLLKMENKPQIIPVPSISIEAALGLR